MGKTVQYTITLNDLISSKLSSINKKTLNLENEIKSSTKGIKNLGSSNLNPLSNSIDGLKSKLKDLTKNRNLSIDSKELKKLNKEIEQTSSKINKLSGKKSGGLQSAITGSIMGSAAGLIGGAAITDAAVTVGKQIVEVRAEREKLQAVLTTSYMGDSMKAKVKMNEIANMAASTPFSVSELTGAFVKMTNAGINPTMKQMNSLGDLASSVGKDFDQLAEAMLDARTGEFERLKEFGIKAQKHGDMVTFSFKGVKTEVKNTEQAINDYIVGLGDLKGITGSMASTSETLGGKLSNLGDAWDGLMNTMGGSTGLFSGIAAELTSFINDIEALLTTAEQFREKGKIGQASKTQENTELYFKTATEQKGFNINNAKDVESMRKYIYKETALDLKDAKSRNLEAIKRLEKENSSFFRNPFKTNANNSAIAKYKGENDQIDAKSASLTTTLNKDIDDLITKAKGGGKDANSTSSSKAKVGTNINSVRTNTPDAINITIQKLIEDFTIETTNITEAYGTVKEMVAKVLIDACNDVSTTI